MKQFIIHDGKKILNRVLAESPIEVSDGQTIIPAVDEWDAPIGSPILHGAPVTQPSKYHVWTGTAFEIPEDVAADLAAKQTERDRVAAMESERSATGIHGVTVENARELLAKKFDAVRKISDPAARLDALIDCCQWIENRIVTFIL